MAASALRNTEAEILAVVREIAGISLDDGIEFVSERAVAEVIREEDEYSGIRVTLDGRLTDEVIVAWAGFAHAGSPKGVGLPVWPAYSLAKRATMRLDGASAVLKDPLGPRIQAVLNA